MMDDVLLSATSPITPAIRRTPSMTNRAGLTDASG